MCACVCIQVLMKAKDQPWRLPQELVTLFSEIEFLTGLELIKKVRLVSQWVPGLYHVHLPNTGQAWHPAFSHGFWGNQIQVLKLAGQVLYQTSCLLTQVPRFSVMPSAHSF